MEHLPIEAIELDATFRLREPGDVSELASAIGRLGQLSPVDVRPLPGAWEGRRWQVVAGFRRMEALRLLQRERVLVRVHEALGDDDAWALALAGVLFAGPWSAADLDAAAEKVRAHLPWALPALEARRRPAARSLASAPSPSAAPRAGLPADPSAFAHALAARVYELNGDVAAAYERWGALPPEGRRLVLEQLRYVARLFPMLEKENR